MKSTATGSGRPESLTQHGLEASPHITITAWQNTLIISIPWTGIMTENYPKTFCLAVMY